MVALARNLDLFGARFLTCLTAIFVVRLHRTPAWQVRTFVLLSCRHHFSRFPKLILKVLLRNAVLIASDS